MCVYVSVCKMLWTNLQVTQEQLEIIMLQKVPLALLWKSMHSVRLKCETNFHHFLSAVNYYHQWIDQNSVRNYWKAIIRRVEIRKQKFKISWPPLPLTGFWLLKCLIQNISHWKPIKYSCTGSIIMIMNKQYLRSRRQKSQYFMWKVGKCQTHYLCLTNAYYTCVHNFMFSRFWSQIQIVANDWFCFLIRIFGALHGQAPDDLPAFGTKYIIHTKFKE